MKKPGAAINGREFRVGKQEHDAKVRSRIFFSQYDSQACFKDRYGKQTRKPDNQVWIKCID